MQRRAAFLFYSLAKETEKPRIEVEKRDQSDIPIPSQTSMTFRFNTLDD